MMKRRSRLWKRTLPLLLAAGITMLLLLPAQAQEQEDGHGVVTFAADASSMGILAQDLFPHLCAGESCAALLPLLYPRLFDVDPQTGILLDASASDRALVTSIPAPLPMDEVILPLSEDRTWSDGAPITAYDVLFSLMTFSEYQPGLVGGALREIAGVRIVDEHTVALRYAASDEEIARLPPGASAPTPTCDDLPRSNVYVIPAHTFGPGFRAFADEAAPEGQSPSLHTWSLAYQRSPQLALAANAPGEPVTSGAYVWGGFDSEQTARLTPVNGDGAALERLSALPASPGRPPDVTAFIEGDLNLLFDPPFSQRAALRALADPNVRNLQIAEVPGRVAFIVQLNLANPQRPLPGFHPETGEPLDQGQHPIFSDVNVRRALQLAIDQDAIIDGIFQQSGARLSGLLPPTSWAVDPTLEPPESNLTAARQILEAAGWSDSNGDGIRECTRCQMAAPGAMLTFTLTTADDEISYRVANQLVEQWQRLGVWVDYVGGASAALTSQTFGAHLLPIGGRLFEDADPDRSRLLTPMGDILNLDAVDLPANSGSYDNPEVTRLAEEARALPDCNIAARADIYHELDRILQQDLPFLFVAAPDEFYAAAPGLIGFAPRAGGPLWNVESWRVTP
jgi:ABC-type transport system substrate-binding protein